MTDNFTPKNNIQRLAYQQRGITDQKDFEHALSEKRWSVPRTTARHWWVNGIQMPTFPTLVKLSKFFRVPIDDLIARD